MELMAKFGSRAVFISNLSLDRHHVVYCKTIIRKYLKKIALICKYIHEVGNCHELNCQMSTPNSTYSIGIIHIGIVEYGVLTATI